MLAYPCISEGIFLNFRLKLPVVLWLLIALRNKWAFDLILFIKLSIFSVSWSLHAEWVGIGIFFREYARLMCSMCSILYRKSAQPVWELNIIYICIVGA